MKRVRRIYVSDEYGRIDSDDPRLGDLGLVSAAVVFAERAARQRFGSNGRCFEISRGDYHPLRAGQRKNGYKSARSDISGYTDYHVLIGSPGGCGLIECEELVIPIRITRARGNREYIDQPAKKRRD